MGKVPFRKFGRIFCKGAGFLKETPPSGAGLRYIRTLCETLNQGDLDAGPLRQDHHLRIFVQVVEREAAGTWHFDRAAAAASGPGIRFGRMSFANPARVLAISAPEHERNPL
jgi:hypothetical protein